MAPLNIRPKTVAIVAAVAAVVAFMIWNPFVTSGDYYPADVTSGAQNLAQLDGDRLGNVAPYAAALNDLTSKCTQDTATIANIADAAYRDLETHVISVASRLSVLQYMDSFIAPKPNRTDCSAAVAVYLAQREGLDTAPNPFP